MRAISKSVEEKVIKKVLQKRPAEEIAKNCGISSSTVRRVAKSAGIEVVNTTQKYTKKQKDLAVKMAKDGVSIAEISKKTGIANSDVGIYFLYTENDVLVKFIFKYVPAIMCPEPEGFGDYIIMNVDENGKIEHFKIKLAEFKN